MSVQPVKFADIHVVLKFEPVDGKIVMFEIRDGRKGKGREAKERKEGKERKGRERKRRESKVKEGGERIRKVVVCFLPCLVGCFRAWLVSWLLGWFMVGRFTWLVGSLGWLLIQ